jgi:hypothetical protein
VIRVATFEGESLGNGPPVVLLLRNGDAVSPVRRELQGFDGVALPSDVSSCLGSTDYVRGAMYMGIGMVPVSGPGLKYRRIGLLRFVNNHTLRKEVAVDFEII